MSNITQGQFVLNIVKFGLTVEFAEVPVCQFVPPMNFSPVETEITDAEISKLLSEGVIANTTREPNDYATAATTATEIYFCFSFMFTMSEIMKKL